VERSKKSSVLQGPAGHAYRRGCVSLRCYTGVTSYFLTYVKSMYFWMLLMICRHAHSDHYTNLSSNWKHGPIYCSGMCLLFLT